MVGLLDIVHWIFLQVLPSCSLSICTYLDSKHTDLWMYHCFTSTLRLKIEFYDSLILMQKKNTLENNGLDDEHPISGKKKKNMHQAPGRRQCLSLLHGLSPATQTHGEGALHQSDLVVQRQIRHVERPWWTMDFPMDFQGIFNGKPWIFHHFNGFSNDFPMNYGFSNGNQWFSNDFQGKIRSRNHGFSHEIWRFL